MIGSLDSLPPYNASPHFHSLCLRIVLEAAFRLHGAHSWLPGRLGIVKDIIVRAAALISIHNFRCTRSGPGLMPCVGWVADCPQSTRTFLALSQRSSPSYMEMLHRGLPTSLSRLRDTARDLLRSCHNNSSTFTCQTYRAASTSSSTLR